MTNKYAQLIACACLLLAAAAVATGGFATAASPSSTLTACAKKRGKNKGVLRLATRCKKSERKVTWTTQGSVGTPGVAGAPGADAIAPAGAVMHFDLPACPAGWSEFADARGRYLVGLPSGGTAKAAVGTALSNGENRPTGQHTHGVNDPGHTHNIAYDTDMLANIGNTIGGTRLFGVNNGTAVSDLGFTGITIQNAGDVAGTNAPYLQLLACRKD
jgi:hypothetical protein